MNLAQELSEIRKEKGITQRWLTEQIQRHMPEMTEDKLSRRLLGKVDITGIELLLIAKYLGVDLNELKNKV
ncbi:MAG: helix-turn-helix transcriptional regulator [Tissierellia bacterium]|nr:helix-turn-helix transcriptional regulator [Tissierellia bacterium]